MRGSDIYKINIFVADQFLITAVRLGDIPGLCECFSLFTRTGSDRMDAIILKRCKCLRHFLTNPSGSDYTYLEHVPTIIKSDILR